MTNYKIGDIFDIKSSSVDKVSRQGEIKVKLLNYLNVYNDERINKINSNEWSNNTANESQFLSSNLKKDDVVFLNSSEERGDIGISSYVEEDIPNAVYSYHILRFRKKEEFKSLNTEYFNFVLHHLKTRKIMSSFAAGGGRYTISIENLKKIEVELLDDVTKQKQLVNLFNFLRSEIKMQKRKISFLYERKKVTMDSLFSKCECIIKFNDIYKKKNIKNSMNYDQYSIGKNGIRKFSKTQNHKIDNHIIFSKNDLIIGIGVEEISINTNFNNGSCSPIYSVFENISDYNDIYLSYLIPFFLFKMKNKFTKRSNRREYEVVLSDLFNLEIKLHNKNDAIKYGEYLSKMDDEINLNNKRLILLEERLRKLLSI